MVHMAAATGAGVATMLVSIGIIHLQQSCGRVLLQDTFFS